MLRNDQGMWQKDDEQTILKCVNTSTVTKASMSSSFEISTNSQELLHHLQDSSADGKDTISHSLLSVAKDARYIGQCYKLLLETMQSINKPSPSRSSETVTNRSSMLLSVVLYVLIVVRPSERTLGMEVCGLKFEKSRGLVRKLGLGLLGFYVLDTVADKARNNHTIEDQEALRGTNRMEMHRRLRRQMRERAQSQIQSSNITQPNPSQTARTEPSNPLSQRLATLIKNFINVRSKKYSAVLQLITLSCILTKSCLTQSLQHSLDQSEGPHSLENQEAAFESRLSLVAWILRLHMAHYCVTGTYPTVIHRLLRLNHAADGSTDINFRPETSRVVALLIGVQAAASMARYLINFSADAVAEILESRRLQLSMRGTTQTLEQSVFKNISLRSDMKSHSCSTCGICRLERKYAAASIHCGHVFCWNCLYQWMSTVQEACPLCRRPCRTRDVLFLHNYQQAK